MCVQPVSVIDRSSKQKTGKDIVELNSNNQLTECSWHLRNTSSKNSRIYILLKLPRIFIMIEHILGHQAYLNKIQLE